MSRFRAVSALALLALAPHLTAQQPVGRIEGVVTDAASHKPIADAGVQIVGTTLGTMTRADGKFSIGNIPAGTVTIQVRRLGYQPQTITGLSLTADQVLTQDVGLSQAIVRVAAQIIRASADRGTVSSALEEQRLATNIQSSVTAEQISRSPDGNAAQAAQRVSGVTVQEGKYVFVRGLGERYTTTSLNGARLPSPEPERKTVPFDLFPSGLLQSVTTNKSFTPDLPGDFSGASVDIKTREYPAERTVTFATNIGYTSGTLGNRVPFVPGVGGEAFALSGSARDLPEIAREAGNFAGVTQQQKNAVINSFRDVWRPGFRNGHPNGSFRASLGGNDRMFARRIGYLLSGTYSYGEEFRNNEVRSQGRPTGPTTQELKDSFVGSTSGQSVLWGALLNAGTLLSANSRLTLNAVYNRTADNDARIESGFFAQDGPAEITRLDYVQRSMWSLQLTGEHDIGPRKLDWSVSGSGVTRDEPDKSELIYNLVPATSTEPERRLWDQSTGEGAVRTFSLLDETSLEARINHRWNLGRGAGQWFVKVGALGRGTVRDADTHAYGLFAPVLSESVRELPPEVLFGGRFTAPDSAVIDVQSLAQGGSYSAEDGLGAAYLMTEFPITTTLSLLTGARLEYNRTHLDAASTLGDIRASTTRQFTDVLPSLVLTYRPNDWQAIRVSGSRTLARPEYRELAGVRSRDVHGGIDLSGNKDLVRTLIDNADLRWELYPRPGELLSVAAFAKRFHYPIERVSRSSSNNDYVTFVNAQGASNYGVELEARQRLDVLAHLFTPFTAFTSVTLMRSDIQLGDQAGASTNPDRAMVGQAPYVVNAGLTYTRGEGSATMLFNRVGDRIIAAGVTPMPDVKELARNQLDFALRVPARRDVLLRLDAKNLLHTDHHVQQGLIVREFYHLPRTLQIGVTVER